MSSTRKDSENEHAAFLRKIAESDIDWSDPKAVAQLLGAKPADGAPARAWAVRGAFASVRLEGGKQDAITEELARRYIAGDISIEQWEAAIAEQARLATADVTKQGR